MMQQKYYRQNIEIEDCVQRKHDVSFKMLLEP